MASLFIRNGVFYGQWNDAHRNPPQRRLSLKTKDEKIAAALLARADEAYRMGRFDPWLHPLSDLEPERPADPIKLSDAVDEWLEAMREDFRPLTVANYRSVLNGLTAAIGGSVPVARLRTSDLAPYALSPSVKRSTRRKRIAALRSWLDWCQSEGHVTENVAKDLKAPREQDRARSIVQRAVTLKELDRICEAVETDHARRIASENPSERCPRLWLIAVFRLAFYTGLRAGEIARLRWEDVDLDGASITLTEQKNGKADTVPLPSPAVALLADLAETADEGYVFKSPWGRKAERNVRAWTVGLNRYFTEYAKAAGIKRHITFHGLRHGFASHLAAKGKSAFVIQAACRHSSITVSQIYVSLANKTLRAELEDVFD